MASHVIQGRGALSSDTMQDRLVNAFRAWRAERTRRARLSRELAMLSERDMADLGFSRGDVPSIIRGTFKR